MGPQGSITTTEPYIKQEKWDDLIHTAHEFNQIGTTHAKLDTSALTWSIGTDLGDPLNWYTDTREFWRHIDWDGMWWKRRQYYWGDDYRMAGAYKTNAEDAWDDLDAGKARLISIIESNCLGFTGSIDSNRMIIPLPTKSSGSAYIQSGDRVVQNTFYDTTRHNYT
jgi:hypothetical protein